MLQALTHVAGVTATALLVSIVTAGAAIAASGIGHAIAAHTACGAGKCASGLQARSSHTAKASATIAIRGNFRNR